MVEGAGGKVGAPHKNSARDCPRRWQVRPGCRSWGITAAWVNVAEFLDVTGRAVEFETRDRLVVEILRLSSAGAVARYVDLRFCVVDVVHE